MYTLYWRATKHLASFQGLSFGARVKMGYVLRNCMVCSKLLHKLNFSIVAWKWQYPYLKYKRVIKQCGIESTVYSKWGLSSFMVIFQYHWTQSLLGKEWHILVKVLNCITENVGTKSVRAQLGLWVSHSEPQGGPHWGLCYPPHSSYMCGACTGEAYVYAYGILS